MTGRVKNVGMAAFAAATVALVSVAMRAQPAADDTIRACVKAGGQMSLLPAGASGCGKNETLITWNVRGPRGETGPAGVTGPEGPQGLQGVPGPAGAGLDAGAIEGRLLACSGGTAAGVGHTLIGLQGRSFLALTAPDGAFRIDYVPSGTYALAAPGTGHTVSAVEVVNAATTTVPDIYTTNLQSDPNNCGACGVSCGGAACVNGACETVVCSGNGVRVGGMCICSFGWTGPNCETSTLPAAWVPGAWSACSVACGGGIRTRPVTCMVFGSVVPDAHCAAFPKPATSESCNLLPCGG